MTAGDPESRARIRLGAIAVAVAGALAYSSSFGGVFVYDDVHNIVQNPHLARLWPPTGWLWARPGFGLAGRPVVSLTFALNHAFGGLGTGGYHALNLAIHLGAALFLFGLVRRALLLARGRAGEASFGLALATAALWVVHPLTTGAVTYLYQRCESLMGFFLLGTCYLSLRSFTEEHPLRWRIGAVAACLLGAGCKETMVVAPLLVLLLDALLASGSLRAALRAHRGLYGGLFLSWIAIAVLVVTSGARADSVGFSFAQVTAWDYLRAQAAGIVLYVRLSLWPHPLVFDYGWPIPQRVLGWMPQGLAVLAALGITLRGLARRAPAALCGAWFFLILAPSSSFLPIATELVVEHRAYLPVAAVILLVLLALQRMLPPRAWPAFALAAVLALGVRTWDRNLDYHSEQRLWRSALQRVPGNPRAHYAVGDIARASGRRNEALMHYEEAVRLDPEGAEWRVQPGVLLMEFGETERAIAHLAAAVRLKPDWALAHYDLGLAHVQAGNPEAGIESFREALRLAPQWPEAVRGLGIAQARAGHRREALRALRAAVAARRRDLEALVELGELLVSAPEAELRDGEEALKLGRRAQRITEGRDARALALVAAAQAETGDFAGALVTARRALELGGVERRAEYERRVEMYLERRTLAGGG